MTHCLNPMQMEQLLADALPEQEQSACDEHLSDCATCRDRLEALTDVTGISSLLEEDHTQHMLESSHLKLAIERLHSEVTFVRSLHSTMNAQASIETTIPNLQPTMKPGFMGRLGDIQIKRVIGQGGMGVVFEGLDAVLNRTVAVKVLSPQLLNHPGAKDRFVREAQAAAALLHENVVAIHGIHEAVGMPYLVLQYIQGESLSEKLQRETRLPLDQVIKLGRQVARGLAAAHDRGLVHRDIKPGNILFDAETGDVRIADFGLVKHVGTETQTAEGVLAGTPAYMSPEQASDKAIDARSDLFSLGVVLYQASSGQMPFTPVSPFVLLDHIRTAQEKPLQELNPALPAWFCSLVHRLLRKEPENRVPSALEVVRILDEQSIAPEPSRKPVHGAAYWPYIILGIIILSGIGIYWMLDPSDSSGTPGGTQAVASKSQLGFSVNGNNTLLPTLAEAIESAPEGGVIDVHGDGPFSCNTIKIENKKLTIRSAIGSHPRIIPEVIGTSGYRQFITTNADLRLEGLEIFWPLIPSSMKTEEPLTRSVITSYQGKLAVINCRIVSGPATACIGTEGQGILLERSHLASPNGVCLGWRMGAEPIHIENCMLEGRFALTVARAVGNAEVVHNPVTMVNNNIKAHRFIHYIIDSRSKILLDCNMVRNVIDCNYLMTLISVPKPLTLLNTHESMLEAMQNTMSWRETANTYRRKTVYLASARLASLGNAVSSDFKQLAPWLAQWKQENAQSQEGTIVFREFTPVPGKIDLLPVLRGEGGSEVPEGVGVIAPHVGPGAAYAAWRNQSVGKQ